ncbi:hypothetical protein THAOC_19388, partial [Thalassiosira oceanica]
MHDRQGGLKCTSLGKTRGAGPEAPEELRPVRGVPGRQAGHHLVQDHPESPVVDAEAVAGLVQDLRGHVLGSCSVFEKKKLTPARALRPPRRVAYPVLRQAEVPELHVAVRVEQNVLRLEVPVYDPVSVEVAYGQEELGRVEPRHGLLEPAVPREVEEELAPGQ